MIVFKKATDGGNHTYSHIECDVRDCGEVSPIAERLIEKSLFARGWFVAGGVHRCPKHYHDEDVAAHGPIERAADGSEGFVR